MNHHHLSVGIPTEVDTVDASSVAEIVPVTVQAEETVAVMEG